MKINTHVVPHEEGWALKREGSKRASRVFERKVDALRYAVKDMKKQSCVYVHGRDGRIRDVRCIY